MLFLHLAVCIVQAVPNVADDDKCLVVRFTRRCGEEDKTELEKVRQKMALHPRNKGGSSIVGPSKPLRAPYKTMLPLRFGEEKGSTTEVIFRRKDQTLLKFKLLEVIGQGGMGSVYRGESDDLKSAAIKFAWGAKDSRRLYQEAIRMSIVDGSYGFPALLAHGESTSSAVLAMEYFPAGDVYSKISHAFTHESSGSYRKLADAEKFPFLPFVHPIRIGAKDAHHKRVVRVAMDAFTKVDTLHRTHRLLHRDIKPGNVLLDADGMFILADLGDGMTSTPEYYSERLMYGHNPCSADDHFAMLLTLLQYEGILTPFMIQERFELTQATGKVINVRSLLKSFGPGEVVTRVIENWDTRFRIHVLEKAVVTDKRYRVWLELWNLLKDPLYNTWGAGARTPPSPYSRMLSFMRGAGYAQVKPRRELVTNWLIGPNLATKPTHRRKQFSDALGKFKMAHSTGGTSSEIRNCIEFMECLILLSIVYVIFSPVKVKYIAAGNSSSVAVVMNVAKTQMKFLVLFSFPLRILFFPLHLVPSSVLFSIECKFMCSYAEYSLWSVIPT